MTVIHNSSRSAVAKIEHHRWNKRRRILKRLPADEGVEVWVFLDLLDQRFIREPETGLDDQGTQCHAEGFCRGSKALGRLNRVVDLDLIPRIKLRPLDPAVVSTEFAAKRQEEVFKRELLTMLTPVLMENSGQLLGSNRPDLAHDSSRKF
jgi:hypothetical protein